MSSDVQRAIDKQAKLEAELCDEAEYWWPQEREYRAHLRNQAKLARAVIEASMLVADDVCGLLQGCGVEGDPATCVCVPHRAKRALAAWADHVNGEET